MKTSQIRFANRRSYTHVQIRFTNRRSLASGDVFPCRSNTTVHYPSKQLTYANDDNDNDDNNNDYNFYSNDGDNYSINNDILHIFGIRLWQYEFQSQCVMLSVYLTVTLLDISCIAVVRQQTLQWRHNGHSGYSNHQPHDCLRFIQPQIKENIKFTGDRSKMNAVVHVQLTIQILTLQTILCNYGSFGDPQLS